MLKVLDFYKGVILLFGSLIILSFFVSENVKDINQNFDNVPILYEK